MAYKSAFSARRKRLVRTPTTSLRFKVGTCLGGHVDYAWRLANLSEKGSMLAFRSNRFWSAAQLVSFSIQKVSSLQDICP
jgi:hypothetical protein